MSRPYARIATTVLAALAFAAGALVVAPTASAADLPRPTVSHTTVKANEQYTVSGTGCVAGPGGVSPWVTLTSPDTTEMGDGMLAQSDGSWSLTEAFSAGHPQGTFRLRSSATTTRPNANIRWSPSPTASCRSPRSAPRAARPWRPAPRSTPEKGVAPGEKRVLRLTGYLPNETVTLVLHSTPQNLGTFTADSSGTVTVAFTAPAGTPAGAHNLVVTRADGSTVTYPVTIAAAAAARPTLASTGADVTAPLLVGITLLLAGAGALFLARRSRGVVQA